MLHEWRLIQPDMRIGVRIVATMSSVAGATKIHGVTGDMPTASRFVRPRGLRILDSWLVVLAPVMRTPPPRPPAMMTGRPRRGRPSWRRSYG